MKDNIKTLNTNMLWGIPYYVIAPTLAGVQVTSNLTSRVALHKQHKTDVFGGKNDKDLPNK